MTKEHSVKEVQYLCTVFANKHFSNPAIEPKQKIQNQNEIVLFIFVCDRIQRETFTRKCCNLTLNLCTVKYHLCTKMKKHIWTRSRVCVQTWAELFNQMNKPTLLDFKVLGGLLIFCFLGYWTICVSHSPAFPHRVPASQTTRKWLNAEKQLLQNFGKVTFALLSPRLLAHIMWQ